MKNPTVRAKKSDAGLIHRNSQGSDSESPDGRRIRVALHALGPGHDLPWLARKTEIPSSTIYDNLKRGIGKPDIAVKIAAALGVSLDWLLTGKEGGPGRNVGAADELGLAMIPEVDISYSLGGGAVHDEYFESRLVPFRRDWLERISRGRPADFFLAGGAGDSMMPTILDGDDVLVNRAEQAIRHQDRIWAVGYGELGMIKRVRRLPSGLFQLNSDNPAVTPIEAPEDELFVVGRVAWIGRRV